MSRYLLGFAAALALSSAAGAQAPPAESFARLPAVAEAAISPNGQNIAILGGGPVDRMITFSVIDQAGVRGVKLGDVETISLHWVGDEYAIARVAAYDKVGPRADYRLLRNAAVSRDGKFLSFLLQGDQLSSNLINHRLLGVVKGPPARVMVSGLMLAPGPSTDMNTRLQRKGEDGDMRVPAIYAVDPVTGRGTRTERGDFDTGFWEVDLAGEARLVTKIDQLTLKRRIFARPKGDSRWRLIQDGDDGREFLGYADVGDALYYSTKTPAGVQLNRLRLSDGAVESVGKPVAGDLGLRWDSHTNGVVGVISFGDETGVEWLDPVFASASAGLARAFKGRRVVLRSWSEDRTRFLASVEGPDKPATWYLYDRPRKEISPVGEEYPELAGVALGTTSFFRYKARDGLEIPAYLTLPPGGPAAGKAPLVVLPHGGPAARDSETFEYLVQFLASRGYAVLRPQYRGSTGFGQTLSDAGKGEWGGKMQTDLLDGVAAVAANSAIDARRACIVGISFGGYSALSGAVFHASAYRCAASIAGVADLGLLITEKGTDFGRTSRSFQMLRDEIRAAAPEGLGQVSPLRRADKAAIPVLLIHGDQDTVVGLGHSKQMAEALRRAGKPFEYVVLAGENHSLAKTASRLKMLEALEAFLGKHLPAAATPADHVGGSLTGRPFPTM